MERYEEYKRDILEGCGGSREVIELLNNNTHRTLVCEGIRWADENPKTPWKEGLPPYDEVVICHYGEDDYVFNHRSQDPRVDTTPNGWCRLGIYQEPLAWMPIPKANKPKNI